MRQLQDLKIPVKVFDSKGEDIDSTKRLITEMGAYFHKEARAKELNAKLIDPMMRGYYKIQFDREALYTTDLTTKANYMKATIEAGVRTVNEWRRADGFPMLEGGDEAVVSANLVTLKSRINEGQQEGNTQS
jgi:hypothetical protein